MYMAIHEILVVFISKSMQCNSQLTYSQHFCGRGISYHSYRVTVIMPCKANLAYEEPARMIIYVELVTSLVNGDD